MTERQKGTLCVFLSAVLYSIGGLCIKVIPWNGLSINGGRSAIALFVVGTYMILTKHSLRFNRYILIGALSVFGTNTLFSIANKMTTAANAIVLQFTAPIFVMLFAFLIFQKRPTKLDYWTCVVVLGGILFFFVDSLEMGGGMGNLLALISGVTYAGVFLMNELPGGDSLSCIIWGYVLSAVTGLPSLVREADFSGQTLISLFVLGIFQVGVAHILLSVGLKSTPAITASLVSGVEPVLNPIWVAVFYGETVGTFAMIGAVIVIGGVLVYNVLKVKLEQESCKES